MSDWEIVRRPRLEPHSGSGVDPSQDWRRFVLEQVGYDEVGRARSARRADRAQALKRFVGGIIVGLIVFALAFGAMLAVQAFRAGRFDRYLPKSAEVSTPPPPSARWAREVPPEPTEARDSHRELQNPLAPPPRVPSPDADDSGSEEGGD